MSNTVKIEPLSGPIKGSVAVSGDKSISHRSILFSAMSEGTSKVSGVLDSADVRTSIEAVTALGAKVDLKKQSDGSLTGEILVGEAKDQSNPLLQLIV